MWASDNEGKGSENALGVKEVGELLLRNVLKFKNKIKKEMYSEDNVDGIWPMARFGGIQKKVSVSSGLGRNTRIKFKRFPEMHRTLDSLIFE